jgi:mannosylglycerate hydrolase
MTNMKAIVVPMSHWDREWYDTFEQFRYSLVKMVDELLDVMDRDPAYTTFLLDGQTVILEDYLQIRPENEGRIRALVGAGRLQVGPWYVQPDEYLVSGEALIRNLLIGRKMAEAFGKVENQGYVPDSFGHIAQLPQILNGFDIHTFYFMRGLGEDVEDTRAEFWWQGLDGSRVLAHYLSESYTNAAVATADPETFSLHHPAVVSYRNLHELLSRLGERATAGVVLLLNGGDHLRIQPELPEYLRSLNAKVDGVTFTQGTLSQFEAEVRKANPDLKTVTGELHFGKYHPILQDVLSTRMYLKQRNEELQCRLEGGAERLAAAVFALGGPNLSHYLQHAWKTLLKNHAHDSICGCSTDEIHREMMTRFSQVEQIAGAVIQDGLRGLAAAVQPKPGEIALFVWNPSPFPRSGLVTVHVAPYEDVPLGERRFGWSGERVDLTAYDLVGPDGQSIPFELGQPHLVCEDALYRRKTFDRVPVTFWAADLPAMAGQVYRFVRKAVRQTAVPSVFYDPQLENERLLVRAEPDGTVSLLDKASGRWYRGLLQFIDEGDAGDEYTYSPPAKQTVVRGLSGVRVARCGAHTLEIQGTLTLPKAMAEDRSRRSEDQVDVPVTTTLTLLPGSRWVECRTTIDNQARDHRLRLCFPTGLRPTHSIAETAFGVMRHPVQTEKKSGWREPPLGTKAQRRFVAVEAEGCGFAVLNKGLPEYELTASGDLLLTLLRCVGYLSRDDLRTRFAHAGPGFETPDAQCIGVHTFEYALVPYTGSWQEADLPAMAEAYTVPLLGVSVHGKTPWRPADVPGSLLAVRGATLSAFKISEAGDGVVVRVYNATDREADAWLGLGFPVREVARVNLNEDRIEGAEVDAKPNGGWRLRLRPFEIATLKVWPAW